MKTALLFDGENIGMAARGLNFQIDYKRVLNYFTEHTSARFYVSTIEDAEGFVSMFRLLDWMAFNGWSVTNIDAGEFNDRGDGLRKARPAVLAELIVDAMDLADSMNDIVLATGDGAMLPLIKSLRRRGVRVTVLHDEKTCSRELRREADSFINLSDIQASIERRPQPAIPRIGNTEALPAPPQQAYLR